MGSRGGKREAHRKILWREKQEGVGTADLSQGSAQGLELAKPCLM